jgi:hypothetical protein
MNSRCGECEGTPFLDTRCYSCLGFEFSHSQSEYPVQPHLHLDGNLMAIDGGYRGSLVTAKTRYWLVLTKPVVILVTLEDGIYELWGKVYFSFL